VKNVTARVVVLILVLSLGLPALAGCNGTATTTTSSTTTASTSTVGEHAGIVVYPSVPSPWPDLPVYQYPNVIESVSPGEEFCIGMDINDRLGTKLNVNVEGKGLTLEDSERVYADPQNPGPGTAWYRFKVTEKGNSFVTLEIAGAGEVVITKLLFAFYSS